MATAHINAKQGDFASTVLMPGDPLRAKLIAEKYLENAAAYLFPSKEPFGIAPVEALAAGCPVIAYKEGGALDYIKDKENGLFFNEQTTNSLAAAIEEFLKLKEDKKSFPAKKISDSALPFDTEIFKAKMKEFIDEKIG